MKSESAPLPSAPPPRPAASRALAVGLGLGLSLLLNLAAVLYQLHIIAPGRPSYTYVGADRPRELPLTLRRVNMAFHNDDAHYAMDGPLARAEWGALRPPNGGDVYLGAHALPFSVSMWHQLQCLNELREAVVGGEDGTPYTAHCLHYLRQALLCRADLTLEEGGTSMADPRGGGTIAPTVNMSHTCRDWRQVYDWTVERRGAWTPEMVRLQEEMVEGTFLAMGEGL